MSLDTQLCRTRLPATLWAACLLLTLTVSVSALAQSRHNTVKSTKNGTTSQTILFFGNSLTAGYGVGPKLAFPNLVQQKVDSLGWPFRVINAGLSGETSAGGVRRIDWVLRQPVDVFVLELGGNDALRGIDATVTERNLQHILDRVKARNPHARLVIAGMLVPPNWGEEYANRFAAIFPRVAEKNGAALIPFLLAGVGGVPELNLPDRIHPNVAGHRLVAENVWRVLEPLLRAMVHPKRGKAGQK